MAKLFIIGAYGFLLAASVATVSASEPTFVEDFASVSHFTEHNTYVVNAIDFAVLPEAINIDSLSQVYFVPCAVCAPSQPKVSKGYVRYRARSTLTRG